MNKKEVTIIAEAGVNHNGDIAKALELIDVAARSGANFIKFQTFKADLNMTKTAKKAAYQEDNTGTGENQYEMIKKLELTFDDFRTLYQRCNEKGIGFLSTGFDEPSLDFLNSLDLELFKIPSGEITNLPYLRKIATYGRPVVMSTGMATLKEVRQALNILIDQGLEKEKISIVHCNTEYPTPMEDVNLLAMLEIKRELGTRIGYSDHTLGIEVPIAAVALGAEVIEKHFTLDKTLPGPDHKASLEPNELMAMIKSIRNIEQAMSGSGKKEPSKSEEKNRAVARKSIIARENIRKGDVFTEQNLCVKRPGSGMSPMKWDEVLGTVADRDFQEDELIEV